MGSQGARKDPQRQEAHFTGLIGDSSPFVELLGHGDNFCAFHFVASCELVSVESKDENCQTHRTVGRTVLALMETPAAIYKDGKLSRLI
jgi:hypothetical protein